MAPFGAACSWPLHRGVAFVSHSRLILSLKYTEMGAAPKLAILSELLDSFLLSTSTETIKNRNSHQLQYMCFRLDTQNKVSLERELYLQKESHLSLWNLRISGRMVRGETKVPKAEQFLESFRADPPGYRRGTKNHHHPPIEWRRHCPTPSP